MKLLIVSDTHGNDTFLRRAFDTDITHVVHLGDGIRDLERLKDDFPHITELGIKGNNDFTTIYPEEMYFELLGHRFFATHGHKYNVRTSLTRLYEKARNIGADVVLFGHTHLKYDGYVNEIRFLNPSAYGAIIVSREKIEFV